MRTDSNLEEQITRSLEQSAERVLPVTATGGAWAKSQKQQVNRQRTRMLTSVCAAIALLAAGFGVYKSTDLRKRNVAQTANEQRVRLVPTWTPDGVALRLQEGISWGEAEPQQNMVVWRQGDRRISATVLATNDPRYVNNQTLDQAIALLTKQPSSWQHAAWIQGDVALMVTIAPALPQSQAEVILRGISVDPLTKAVSPRSLPTNFREVFRGDAKVVAPVDSWTMFPAQYNGQRVSVYAVKRSMIDREIYGDEQDGFGFDVVDEVEVRGRKAKLFESKAVQPENVPAPESPTRFEVKWSERGWDVSVSGVLRDDVIKVAQGLKDAADEEWAEFPRYSPGGINTEATPAERRQATKVAATVETESGSVNVRAGELVTAEGCVHLVFTGIGKEEKHCVSPSGKPILWSGVREVGGQKVVLAVVDLHVDAVMLVSKDEPVPSDIVSSLSINDTVPAGFVVDVSEDGATYKWIGIVALPFDGDKPGDIEAFSSTEFDREAPSEIVDTDADTGSVTESSEPEPESASIDVDEPLVEYDMPLKSLGRFPVG
jgi:hypothetical protein